MEFLLSTKDVFSKLSPLYTISLKFLEAEAGQWRVPYHLGLILDGNRRYAKKHHIWDIVRGRFGYEQGADKLEEFLQWCNGLGIKVISVWIVSITNFKKRDKAEMESIFDQVKRKARAWIENPEIHASKIKIRFLGEIYMLPTDVQEAISAVEEATKNYDQYLLNIYIRYDGREEILGSFRKHLGSQLVEGKDLAQVTNELSMDSITKHLYTSGLPDPDLIIRPGGRIRLSGFMIWQSMYTELFFCSTYWPEFRKLDFLRAIREYNRRERTFGK